MEGVRGPLVAKTTLHIDSSPCDTFLDMKVNIEQPLSKIHIKENILDLQNKNSKLNTYTCRLKRHKTTKLTKKPNQTDIKQPN